MSITKDLGLLDSEWAVYNFLLKSKISNITEISKGTNLNRVSVYKALNKLSKIGLVNEVMEAKKRLFEPANPKLLNKIVANKKKELITAEKEIINLEKIYNKISKDVKATIHVGTESVKAIWEDILKDSHKNDEWLIIGAPKSADILAGYFKEFNKVRARKKVKMKIIYNKDAKELINERKRQPLTKVRVMPGEYITPVSLEIINNKVLIVFYEPKIMAFVIESRESAKSFKQYFDLLWKIAK
ncbi:hypothetical protein J4447_04795 [Candidatus Pacearchaeota archaeon]|nr:hypothetical protein [Candidatus Pacearchaeota archaeon]